MNSIANTDKLTGEDEATADALGGTLSLADTLEEDRERYQDVIRDLTEFEDAEGATGAVATAEDVHDLDARHETTVA
ncbi:MAG: hypothetical protein ACJ741_14535 [Pyrinomonadaceae bacterium]